MIEELWILLCFDVILAANDQDTFEPPADKRDLTAKSENLQVMYILKILSIQSHS